MHPSDPGLLVLHAVRLAGFADAPVIAERLGLPPSVVETHLANAVDDGFARRRDGARPGWSLTEEGRKENERLLADELDAAGRRDEVTAAYRRFAELNPRLLKICTAWQVRDPATGALNDHADPDYDRAVVDRLLALHDAAEPLLADLGASLERFSGYRRRFDHAAARVRGGDGDWFTRPTIDSYHTAWFELHEDLLATLGLDRSAETGPPTTKEA